MDYGLTENEYWEMTLAEIIRYIESQKRKQLIQAREKASFDYIHAELVGRSIARIYSNSARYPAIEEAYPSLFSTEEIQQQKQDKKDELSVIRFKQFANSFNKRFKEVGEQ